MEKKNAEEKGIYFDSARQRKTNIRYLSEYSVAAILEKKEKYKEWGLLFFVAVPLPGTGCWTGALISALMDLRIKKSLPIIALGVFIAGLIMSLVTYGIF